jgi:hypothetical protein
MSSGLSLQAAQRAKLDERLDRIEELEELTFESIAGLIYPFHHALKKMKIHGEVALRPILTLGPIDAKHEVTFLLIAKEINGKLPPDVKSVGLQRLQEVENDPKRRRQRYKRDSGTAPQELPRP